MSNNILHPNSLNSGHIGQADVENYRHDVCHRSVKENKKRPPASGVVSGYYPPATRWKNDFFVQFAQ